MRRQFCFRTMALCFVIAAAVSSAQMQSPGGYETVLRTLSDLWDYEADGRPAERRIAFEFPQWLVNAYLSASLKLKPRPGVKNVEVELLPGNRIIATAYLDFDSLLRQDAGVIPKELRGDVLRSGRLKAEVQFALKGSGLIHTVKPLPVEGFEIPAKVMQEVVRCIAAMQPEKFDTTRPIPVPFGLRKLYSGAGLLGGST